MCLCCRTMWYMGKCPALHLPTGSRRDLSSPLAPEEAVRQTTLITPSLLGSCGQGRSATRSTAACASCSNLKASILCSAAKIDLEEMLIIGKRFRLLNQS